MSWLFVSGGQSIGASASVLPMNIQGLFPLALTSLISLLSNGLSRVFSNPTVWNTVLYVNNILIMLRGKLGDFFCCCFEGLKKYLFYLLVIVGCPGSWLWRVGSSSLIRDQIQTPRELHWPTRGTSLDDLIIKKKKKKIAKLEFYTQWHSLP